MAQMLLDLVYSLGNCLNCFPGSPTLKINSRSFKILRLLGEGGFSYVYLVQDTATAELFALKKIRCPFGAESVQQAMREVEAYKTFAHVPGIIHAVDYSVAQDRSDADAKTVYVLLPYYRRGNLQDIITPTSSTTPASPSASSCTSSSASAAPSRPCTSTAARPAASAWRPATPRPARRTPRTAARGSRPTTGGTGPSRPPMPTTRRSRRGR